MRCVLHGIPIDIVEIIIVFSRCPKTFKNTSSFILKLQLKDIQERIVHKLSTKNYIDDTISFTYNNKEHSTYDRPSYISTNMMYWKQNNVFKRNKFLCNVLNIDRRDIYIRNNIDLSVSYSCNSTQIYDLFDTIRQKYILSITIYGKRTNSPFGWSYVTKNILE